MDKITEQDWEKLKQKDVLVKCKHCGRKVKLDTIEKPVEKQVEYDQKRFTVLFWTCLKCHAKYIVMIKDAKMNRLLIDYECKSKMMLARHMDGKALSKSNLNQLLKQKKANDEYQLLLKYKYATALTALL